MLISHNMSSPLEYIRPLNLSEEQARKIDLLAMNQPHLLERPYSVLPTREDVMQTLLDPASPLALQQAQHQNPSINSVEYKAMCRRVFRSADYDQTVTLFQLTPYRIRMVWRLVRNLAIWLELINSDEMLCEASEDYAVTLNDNLLNHLDPPPAPPPQPEPRLQPNTSLSREPERPLPQRELPLPPQTLEVEEEQQVTQEMLQPAEENPDPIDDFQDEYDQAMVDALAKDAAIDPYDDDIHTLPADVNPFWTMPRQPPLTSKMPAIIRNLFRLAGADGLALLPPPPPAPDPDKQALDYDPKQDRKLLCYTKMLAIMYRAMHLDGGTKSNPKEGIYGIQGLLDPMTIRLCFPTPQQIMAWETLMVDTAVDLFNEQGYLLAKEQLKEQYGLQQREIDSIIKITRLQVRDMMQEDADESRARLIAQLQNFTKRARDAMDFRGELGGYKQLAILHGLSRSEPDDVLSDFKQVVKKVTSEPAAPRRVIGNIVQKSLPPRKE